MSLPNLAENWRSKAVGAAMLGLAAFGMGANDAHADPMGPDCIFPEQTLPAAVLSEGHLPITDSEIADLVIKANNYSDNPNGGIGTVVLIGDDFFSQGLTPEHAANVIQQKLTDQNVPSLVCFGYVGNVPSGVTFLLKSESVGPLSPGKAVDSIPGIASKYIAQGNIASLELSTLAQN